MLCVKSPLALLLARVTLGLCTVLSACGQPPPEPAAPPAVRDIAFVGVSVLSMVGEVAAVPDQTVLVSGGAVVSIGNREDVSVPDTFAIVDGTDKYLMPGLADMHVHLEYGNDPRVLDLFLANGVTTVRNMDGRPYILEWRDRIARGEMRGPTIHTAGPILDGDPPLRDDNLGARGGRPVEPLAFRERAPGRWCVSARRHRYAESVRRARLFPARRAGQLRSGGVRPWTDHPHHFPGKDPERVDVATDGIRSQQTAPLERPVAQQDRPLRAVAVRNGNRPDWKGPR